MSMIILAECLPPTQYVWVRQRFGEQLDGGREGIDDDRGDQVLRDSNEKVLCARVRKGTNLGTENKGHSGKGNGDFLEIGSEQKGNGTAKGRSFSNPASRCARATRFCTQSQGTK